jgi:DNA-binding MarR family transcriptional regulator
MNSAPVSKRIANLEMSDLDPLDPALRLMFYGWRGMTREADSILARYGLGRAHHRMMFVIARHDGINVGDLGRGLAISTQAMQRPMKQLIDKGLVIVGRDPVRHRFRLLHLTEAGRELERMASEAERRVMGQAFETVGAKARDGWLAVMREVARAG